MFSTDRSLKILTLILIGVVSIGFITLIVSKFVTSSSENPGAHNEELKGAENFTTKTSKLQTLSWTPERSKIGTSRFSTKKPRNVCETPECITLAQQLHNWQDSSVDPCHDFYKHTCGRYQEHSISRIRFIEKQEIVRNLTMNFVRKNESTKSISENVMKSLYWKCEEMQDPDFRKANLKFSTLEFLREIDAVNSWPIMNQNWDESSFDLNEWIVKMVKFGVSPFGFLKLVTHVKPVIEPMREGSWYSKEVFMELYKSRMELLQVPIDEDQLSDDVDDILLLISRLPKVTKNSTMTYSDLKRKVPSLNFDRIIKSVFLANEDSKVLWRRLKPLIEVKGIDENVDLEEVLKSTSKKTLANYLIHFMLNQANLLMKAKDCEKMVLEKLSHASLRFFVRNYFDKENLQIVEKLVEDLRKDFIEMLSESTWLHEETRKNAILKVEKMRQTIGYPMEFEKDGYLDEIFETVFLNFNFSKNANETYYSLRKKIDVLNNGLAMKLLTLGMGSTAMARLMTVNAFYQPMVNRLVVLAGILDDPLFDSSYPSYAKTASTLYIIGHEIGHAFDPILRTFDETGKINDLWANEDAEEYARRTQCLIDQFENYDDPDYGRKLNGSQTISEVVADRLGVKVAWKMFQKLNLENEQHLVGFENYPMDQMYFRLFALTYCGSPSSYPLEKQLKAVHPTSSFRVNGMVSNMDAFSRAFKCPVGSPMNPEKKCELF